MTTPSTSFGLKAFGIIVTGVAIFVTIGWLTARNITPYASPVPQAAASTMPTVAVIPLVNTSGDSTLSPITAMLTDSVTAGLSGTPGLRVSPPQAAAPIRDSTTLDTQRVGTILGVATLVRGTVRREGGQLQVDIRLTDAKSGRDIWSQQFARDTAGALALRDEIVREAVARLLPSGVPKAP